jgi:hypothetical protein
VDVTSSWFLFFGGRRKIIDFMDTRFFKKILI